MKGKGFIFIFFFLFILFISLYIGQATGYYKYEDSKKSILTKSAIKRFEKDLKDGKELKAKNYLEEEKNYSNTPSRIGLGLSNFLENSFNKILVFMFNQIDSEVDNKK